MGLTGKEKSSLFLLVEQGVQTFHPYAGAHRKVTVIDPLPHIKGHRNAAHLHRRFAAKAGHAEPDTAFQLDCLIQIKILKGLAICGNRQNRQTRFRPQPQRCHRPIAGHRTLRNVYTVVIGLCRQAAAIRQNGTEKSKSLRIQMPNHTQSP